MVAQPNINFKALLNDLPRVLVMFASPTASKHNMASTALESLLSSGLSSWDGRLAFTAAAILLPVLLTYAVTFLRAKWIKNVRGKGDPPPVPYAVPIVGNTLQFAYGTEGFLTRTL